MQSQPQTDQMDEMDGIDEIDEMVEADEGNEMAGIDILLKENPYSRGIILGLLDLLVETCSFGRKSIVIAGESRPTVLVKDMLMKLNMESIRYVLNCLEKNTTEVRNIRQYLLAALYNAPVTIGAYYQSKVNSDFRGGISA